MRKLAVILAVAFALGAPAHQGLTGWGLSAGEFASDGNTTLRAAGYAFSIWGLIYAGLVGYAIYQALPRNDANPRLAALGWPAAVAIAGCGAWIVASALDLKWLTVLIIGAAAATLTSALWRQARVADVATVGERVLAWWPLGLLAGWLTIASAINLLTVLTAQGLIGPGNALPAALVGIVAVSAVAAWMLRATRLVAYAAPVAWGLVAVWVAERADKPLVGGAALVAAILVAGLALWVGRPSAARR